MLISGPVSLNVLYSKNDNHYIYIFGDEHDNLNFLCKNNINLIWDFIFNIIQRNPSKLINILIETYQINDDINANIKYNNDVIYNIINTFKYNFAHKKKNTFANAMIHYIDFRYMVSYQFASNKYNLNYKDSYEFFHNMEIIDYNILKLLLNYSYNKQQITNDDYLNISIIYKILLNFKNNQKINTINDYINTFKKYINYSKINKQFLNIHNKNYINILYNFSNARYNYILNKYSYLRIDDILNILNTQNDIKKQKHIFSNSQIMLLYAFYEFNFELQLLLMDLYTMGRLLRHYDEYNLPEFKKNDKYSIIYVGELHAKSYINLLKQMNFKILYTSKKYNKKKRCIEINNNAFSNFNL